MWATLASSACLRAAAASASALMKATLFTQLSVTHTYSSSSCMSTSDQVPPYQPRAGQFKKTFRTDVWVMRADGSHATRLTYINQQGHAQYQPGQHLVIPMTWLDDRSLLFDVDSIEGGRVASEKNQIYRLNLP